MLYSEAVGSLKCLTLPPDPSSEWCRMGLGGTSGRD
jgi:hypothetical protein